ncbi:MULTISPECIES: adenosylcobinamide amidohydrolase [Clostridium]|uniref:Adenosylcobinamide amidohydrolase n=1 Tax=Clostridium senegalense TaxID=1465809 RepID=A0A6M0H329_9CLOT|nr:MULTISPECIES: adenosylcobinamide amidohydrolase [Clostridium]NEU04594.1 adenosylcobinamide amidohydrolase [Clostridium senegalense]
MMIFKLATGDEVHKYKKSIVVVLKDERKVLSTGPLNGGYKENLKYVFNNDGNPGAGIACKMKAPTYEEHMGVIAQELGLDSQYTTGISTAASMENVSIKTENFEDLIVTAIVTGGIEVNGGRVGDPAYYHEKNNKSEMIKLGTINIILVINKELTEGALTRAMVTCTEAKTAAIQELMAGSNYSRGLATGSGTDGTIIICNSNLENKLTNAGKHFKLGELIGKSVKNAVKEALYKQTGLSGESQHSFLQRMKRFNINEEVIWEKYEKISLHKKIENPLLKHGFIHNIHTIERENDLVTLTSVYAHLIDQLDWELLSENEVVKECRFILERICGLYNIDNPLIGHGDIKINDNDCKETIILNLIDKFVLIIAIICGEDNKNIFI